MKMRSSLSEPVIIAQWWRNRAGEALRVQLTNYAGRDCVDIRCWYVAADGVRKSSSQGITCGVKHLPKFASLFALATRKAEELGLLSSASNVPRQRGRGIR
jgi:Transcriptional Coactivator p15 (PC4)